MYKCEKIKENVKADLEEELAGLKKYQIYVFLKPETYGRVFSFGVVIEIEPNRKMIFLGKYSKKDSEMEIYTENLKINEEDKINFGKKVYGIFSKYIDENLKNYL
ncbi:MAG: hypothetical protein QXL97_00295 [Candidatus Aenigmatarchaeota archaeon]